VLEHVEEVLPATGGMPPETSMFRYVLINERSDSYEKSYEK